MTDFVGSAGLWIESKGMWTTFRWKSPEKWLEIGKPVNWDTFCQDLTTLILDQKDDITTMWGKEYDRLLPKG